MTDPTHTNPYAPTDATLDRWTREVIATHFDPEAGTPYWLRWERDRGIDVRDRVEGFADLREVFDPFDEDVLRTLPAAEFAPRSLEGDRRVYETGGTTGAPKRVVMARYWREQARWTARVLAEWGFPTGNVLGLAPPGGANNAGTFLQHLAHEWGALPYHVTMDPRWAKRLSERPDGREFRRYVDHLVGQAETVLESQPIRVLFTTARLLERPRVRELIDGSSIEAVIHGGTALDRDTHRIFREEWYADVALVGEYGNTLMGVAPEAPPSLRSLAERNWHVQYVPCYPYFVPEIVDADGGLVPYGERGTVRLTVLSEEFFIPLLYERDAAIRVPGTDPLPWDWVGTPETGADAEPEAVEGVY
jgi:thienamycin biosynthesis protein ThnN